MYYEVKVKWEYLNEEGKTKKQVISYLVWDTVIEGVHAQIAKEWSGTATGEWSVISVKETKIEKVIDAR
jgi:hypothetical protein